MEIITSIASKIVELLVEAVGRQLANTIFYQGNIKVLVDETENLKDQRAGMQLLMDADIRNLKVILPEVLSWVEKVDKIINESERFLEKVNANKMCLKGWFPNLKLQHSLGRKAKKYAEDVSKLQREGKFEKISSASPTTGMRFSSSMKAFESRTKILNQVMEALKDETMHTIAICGMGGIGKTTMAKEVARRAKEEKPFEEVVMAVVAQNPSVMKIQEEIADMLHLRLTAKSTTGRADELSNRIKNITKILIILDDIWDRLELDTIGIPYGSEHTGCSILLTSRNIEACTQMRSQRNFIIQVLSDGEAWNLFEEAAGTSVNTPDLHPTAKQIAKECRGLPVAIVTVGRALEGKGKDEWNDALHQLQNATVENIFGMDAHVYSSIELSYKFLRSKQVQWCFLLCCLFPEDYNIPIETLVRYGKGLRKFQDTETMEESRSRVHSLIQTLKRRFLLIDSEVKECVKMHDVVRDVALSIANKEHGFVVRCANKIEDWPEIDRREDCTTISLVANEINARLDNLRCQNLKLLHLSTNRISSREQEFEENFCDEMKELKVLALENMRIRSLLFSLRVLRDMRTLHLEYCVLKDISSIGALVNLEVLSLRGSEIQSLPREIGRLEHLKLLDTTGCCFNGISLGVLSSLIKLEELYMKDTISNWCLGQQNREEKICAILAELIPLSDHLKVLDFELEKFQLLPENFVFNNLTRFRICIGFKDYSFDLLTGFREPEYFLRNQLEFRGDITALKNTRFGIHPLLEKCETLNLREVKKLNKEWMDEVGFSRLKDLYIGECMDVEYLVYTNSNLTGQLPFSLLENLTLIYVKNLKALCHPDFLLEAATREFQLFHNLKCLELSSCNELNYVFSTSLARGSFPQLQSLDVSFCVQMEGIVYYKETGENGQNNIADGVQIIVFPKLTNLRLSVLPLLISLYRDMDDNNAVQLCPSRNDIHHTTPKVPESPNVLVPFKILKWLPSLQRLDLSWCDKVRVVLDFHGLIMVMPLLEKEKTNNSEVIGGDDKEHDHFHDHRCWCLKCLPPLDRKGKSIQGNNNNNTLQKKSLDDQINTTTSSHSDAQGEVRDHRVIEQVLYNLRYLEVDRCDSVAVIFNFGEGQGSFPPVLNKLSSLNLVNLKELIHIWNIKNCPQQVNTSSFQNLTSLQIRKCPRLRYIFPPSIAKLLVALESIDVRECKSMQVIVAKNEEDKNVNDVLIRSFLHLSSIYLVKLENLSCFSDQPDCAIQFPSLESVEINGCPKLETFVTAAAMSVEDTPKLKQVEDSDLPQPQLFYGDINTTIKHNFRLKQEKLIQQEKQRQQKKTEAKQRQQEEQISKSAIEQQEEQSSENKKEQSFVNEEEQSSVNEIEQQEEQSYENEEEHSSENKEKQRSENEEEQNSENEIEKKEKQRQQEEQSSENKIEQQEEQSSENEIEQQEKQSSENGIEQQDEESSENERQEEQCSSNKMEQQEEHSSVDEIEQEEEQTSENEIEQEEQGSANGIEQLDEQSSENENEQQEEQCSSNKKEQQEEHSFENEIDQEQEQTSENVIEQEEQGSENEIKQEEEQSSENESEQQETPSFENEIEHQEEQSSENESEQRETQSSDNESEQQEAQSSENESEQRETRSSENESEQQEAQSSENEIEQEEQSSDNMIGQQEEQTKP